MIEIWIGQYIDLDKRSEKRIISSIIYGCDNNTSGENHVQSGVSPPSERTQFITQMADNLAGISFENRDRVIYQVVEQINRSRMSLSIASDVLPILEREQAYNRLVREIILQAGLRRGAFLRVSAAQIEKVKSLSGSQSGLGAAEGRKSRSRLDISGGNLISPGKGSLTAFGENLGCFSKPPLLSGALVFAGTGDVIYRSNVIPSSEGRGRTAIGLDLILTKFGRNKKDSRTKAVQYAVQKKGSECTRQVLDYRKMSVKSWCNWGESAIMEIIQRRWSRRSIGTIHPSLGSQSVGSQCGSAGRSAAPSVTILSKIRALFGWGQVDNWKDNCTVGSAPGKEVYASDNNTSGENHVQSGVSPPSERTQFITQMADNLAGISFENRDRVIYQVVEQINRSRKSLSIASDVLPILEREQAYNRLVREIILQAGLRRGAFLRVSASQIEKARGAIHLECSPISERGNLRALEFQGWGARAAGFSQISERGKSQGTELGGHNGRSHRLAFAGVSDNLVGGFPVKGGSHQAGGRLSLSATGGNRRGAVGLDLILTKFGRNKKDSRTNAVQYAVQKKGSECTRQVLDYRKMSVKSWCNWGESAIMEIIQRRWSRRSIGTIHPSLGSQSVGSQCGSAGRSAAPSVTILSKIRALFGWGQVDNWKDNCTVGSAPGKEVYASDNNTSGENHVQSGVSPPSERTQFITQMADNLAGISFENRDRVIYQVVEQINRSRKSLSIASDVLPILEREQAYNRLVREIILQAGLRRGAFLRVSASQIEKARGAIHLECSPISERGNLRALEFQGWGARAAGFSQISERGKSQGTELGGHNGRSHRLAFAGVSDNLVGGFPVKGGSHQAGGRLSLSATGGNRRGAVGLDLILTKFGRNKKDSRTNAVQYAVQKKGSECTRQVLDYRKMSVKSWCNWGESAIMEIIQRRWSRRSIGTIHPSLGSQSVGSQCGSAGRSAAPSVTILSKIRALFGWGQVDNWKDNCTVGSAPGKEVYASDNNTYQKHKVVKIFYPPLSRNLSLTGTRKTGY